MLEEHDIAVVKMCHMLEENTNSVHILRVNSLTLTQSEFIFEFIYSLPLFFSTACIYSVPAYLLYHMF